MHHGTCVTHVPWYMTGSLNRGGGENVPGIPGPCAKHNVAYLSRAPWITILLPSLQAKSLQLIEYRVPSTGDRSLSEFQFRIWVWVTWQEWDDTYTVYSNKYAYGFIVLCFVVVMQSFIMNSQEVFIHIHQGCFAGTGAIVRLPQCQWSKPDGYGKISQCITTTKHSKAKTVCIFLGICCITAPGMATADIPYFTIALLIQIRLYL